MVGEQLQGRDRLNLALTSRVNHAVLKPALLKAHLTTLARQIEDLEPFRALLGSASQGEGSVTINGASESVRREPLVALALRIVALPLHQQRVAQVLWREAAAPLAVCSPALHSELNLQDKSTRLTGQVEQVNNLEQFRTLLGTSVDAEAHDTVRSLRPDMQVKPLTALASRLASLPAQDQADAVNDFREAVSAIPAQYQIHLVDLAEEAGNPGGLEGLREMACFNAVKGGEPVDEVMRRSGVVNDELRTVLIYTAWGASVKNGELPEDAAVQHGLTEQRALDDAKYFVANEDIDNGALVPEVIAMYDITDPGHLEDMNETAFTQAGEDMLNNNLTLQAALDRHGITREEDIAQLTEIALGTASDEIAYNGASVDDVSARYGLTDPEHVSRLREVFRSVSSHSA